MSVVLLVRHAQASFGSDDYDQLSELGHRQSRDLGAALVRQGVDPDQLLTGALVRQRQTVDGLLETTGWSAEPETDAAWDEYNHNRLANRSPEQIRALGSRAFQHELEAAVRRWVDGDPGTAPGESFGEFRERVMGALGAAAARAGRTVVVTSGGVISYVVAALLDAGVEQWLRLNRVCVNASVTKLVQGRSGLSVVSFNDHSYLSAEAVTYR